MSLQRSREDSNLCSLQSQSPLSRRAPYQLGHYCKCKGSLNPNLPSFYPLHYLSSFALRIRLRNRFLEKPEQTGHSQALVDRDGLEPPTRGSSVLRSTNQSYLSKVGKEGFEPSKNLGPQPSAYAILLLPQILLWDPTIHYTSTPHHNWQPKVLRYQIGFEPTT